MVQAALGFLSVRFFAIEFFAVGIFAVRDFRLVYTFLLIYLNVWVHAQCLLYFPYLIELLDFYEISYIFSLILCQQIKLCLLEGKFPTKISDKLI